MLKDTNQPNILESMNPQERGNYFYEASKEFGDLYPRENSIVRLDQEAQIASDLDQNVPVLIRGYWRIGKTSMLRSLINHHYPQNAVFLDTGGYAGSADSSLELFKKLFGQSDVARFIAAVETGEDQYQGDLSKMWEARDQITRQMEKSSLSPIEYLNHFAAQSGRDVLVGLDEVIAYADDKPELLEEIAKWSELSNIKLAVVLHRIARYEPRMQEIFQNFKTHWVRPLHIGETERLVTHGLGGTDIQFSQEAIKLLHEKSGGRPMEVNYGCWSLLDPASNEHVETLSYNETHVQKVTNQEEWSYHSLMDRVIENYQRIYDIALSREEQDLLSRIANGEAIESADPHKISTPLVYSGLLAENQGSSTYKINGTILQETLVNQIS